MKQAYHKAILSDHMIWLSDQDHWPILILFPWLLFLGRPSAPQNLQIKKVTENAVTLKWDAPESDGGARIKGYVIEKRDAKRHQYMSVGTTKLIQVNEFTVSIFFQIFYCISFDLLNLGSKHFQLCMVLQSLIVKLRNFSFQKIKILVCFLF